MQLRQQLPFWPHVSHVRLRSSGTMGRLQRSPQRVRRWARVQEFLRICPVHAGRLPDPPLLGQRGRWSGPRCGDRRCRRRRPGGGRAARRRRGCTVWPIRPALRSCRAWLGFPLFSRGGRGVNRTLNKRIKSPLLCQLSYTPGIQLSGHVPRSPVRALEVSRTPNPRLRRPMLYPVELRAHGFEVARYCSGPPGLSRLLGGFV
jgi:hypothetical protein